MKIALGVSLGYRRNAIAGTWVVRVADGKGANWTKTIGMADDYDDANGSTIFDFWQAQDRAKAAAHGGKGGPPVDNKPATLRAVLDQYGADLKTRGGDVGNVARVRTHLNDKLQGKQAAELTLDELRTWRDGLTAKPKRKKSAATTEGEQYANNAPKDTRPAKKKQASPPRRLTPSSINRVCTAMKAALNLTADRDGRITSRRPWEQGLATLPDAEESRNVILPDTQIPKLVERASTQGDGFGLFVEGLASTGARVSQLARANVGDFQDARVDPRILVPSSRNSRVPSSRLLPSGC